MTMILGLTGNIASGKSTIARELERWGAVVVDADQLARQAVAPGSRVLQQLVAAFGEEILGPDGELDRKTLGQRVFADPSARARLNALVHPAIAALAEERLRRLRQEHHPLIVYEAPLLFEAAAQSRVDKVLMVTVRPEVQLHRLLTRDGLDEKQARQRIDAQMPQQQKAALADYRIDNSGSWEETREQLAALWEEWTGEAAVS